MAPLVDLPRFSDKAILYLIIWLPIIACFCVATHYLRRELRPLAVPWRKGPQDRFRCAGSFVLAVSTAAFAFAFSDDPASAIPGMHSTDSLYVWAVANVMSLVGFAVMCDQEASSAMPETLALRMYWVLQVCGWGTSLVVRVDPLASSDHSGFTDSPGASAAIVFYFLTALLACLACSYGLIAAQDRFPAKGRPVRLIPGMLPPVQHTDGGDAARAGGGGMQKQHPYAAILGFGEAPAAGDGDGNGKQVPGWGDKPNPECFAGPWSLLYFNWMTPLVLLGFERPLEQQDLEKLHPSDDPKLLTKAFDEAWGKELSKEANGGKASLLKALVSSYGFGYFVGAGYKFVYDAQQFVGPLLLQKLIEFLDSRANDGHNKVPMRVGYELVGLLLVNSVTQSVILHMYFHAAFRTGMRVKAGIIAAVYDKSLRVKTGAATVAAKNGSSGGGGGGAAAAGGGGGGKKAEVVAVVAKKISEHGEEDRLVKEAVVEEMSKFGDGEGGGSGGGNLKQPLLVKGEGDDGEDGGDEKKEGEEEASKKKTSGEIVNLMAVDAQRLMDSMTYIAMLWSGVFQIALSLWYLYTLLGVAVFSGVFVMVTTVPLTGKLSFLSRKLQKKVMAIKDERIKVENEVLGGMKIIKLYAWERPFVAKIHALRDKELKCLWDYKRLQIGSRVLWTIVPTLVSLASFATFTLLGHDLTASTAFTALALFNILRFPLAVLPMAIANAVEAGLSLERIRSFLVAPEVLPLPKLPPSSAAAAAAAKPPPTSSTATAGADADAAETTKNPLLLAPPALTLQPRRHFEPLRDDEVRSAAARMVGGALDGGDDESFGLRNGVGGVGGGSGSGLEVDLPRLLLRDVKLEWDNGKLLLDKINLEVHDAELVMVVGSTGSGKSGLLSAVIGEMVPSRGTLASRGSIAYVSQVAWIQNATLKDNVLFGKPFNQERYASVIDACALTSDLQQLPDGDQTEIGEKGINLSGGQKQRVAIARAVYADADVYLLDDCLSAVDSQVAHHIFSKCIRGPSMLAAKAVLLVTHNLGLVPQADKVVLLDKHALAYSGDFEGFVNLEDNDLAAAARKDNQSLSSAGNSAEDLLEVLALARNSSGNSLASLNALDAPFGDDDDDGAGAGKKSTTKKKANSSGAAAVTKKQAAEKSATKALGGGSKEKPGADGEKGKLIEKEAMMRGSVSLSTYRLYIESSGSVTTVVGVIGGLLLYNLVAAGSSWWLGFWADHSPGDGNDDVVDDREGAPSASGQDDDGGDDDDSYTMTGAFGLGIYTAFSFTGVFISFCAVYANTRAGQRSCKLFHERLVEGVLRAKMSFFDVTPTGRIVNRFSKDVYTLDEVLPNTMYSWISTGLAVLVAVATVAFVVPWFLACCLPMGWVYFKIMRLYIPTSRELQRLESVTRSPVFSHFGETLEGVSTIRAFRAQPQFVSDSMDKLERNMRSYYANVSSNRWLALRLEAIGTGFVTFAALLAVLSAGAISGGEGGLALTYSLNITQVLNWYVRMSSDQESQIVAVERLQEYAIVESEAPSVVAGRRPPADWPWTGEIKFERTAMRYRPGLPLVLKGDKGLGLECTIPGGQKVGVVGRTGAGKSSLLLILLRLVEPEEGGILEVDGLDVLKMGLDDLRSRVSIIPQDPVLFTGTVRFNLDPFSEHPDESVWNALDRSHLGSHVRGLPGGLSAEVEEGGRNFSMGERQLLCLARALLRASRILLLDEATSAVDHATDALVQTTIRSEFKACTVLTIAHRLDTIIDYDRVLVLSEGKVAEDDAPDALLDTEKYPEGIFKAMWEAHQAGVL